MRIDGSYFPEMIDNYIKSDTKQLITAMEMEDAESKMESLTSILERKD